jgi:hypothetical protein
VAAAVSSMMTSQHGHPHHHHHHHHHHAVALHQHSHGVSVQDTETDPRFKSGDSSKEKIDLPSFFVSPVALSHRNMHPAPFRHPMDVDLPSLKFCSKKPF